MFKKINKLRLCKNYRLSVNYSQIPRKDNSHLYKNIFPWGDFNEFAEYLKSCVIYNKDGLYAINKPFGIKIHGHDKPGTRSKENQRYIIPSLPECNYTIEDALPSLEKHLNVPNLSIVKSAERYSSGLVLLSASEKITKAVRKSFFTAKAQKTPHLVHWMLTLGCPVVKTRTEKVGIKFIEIDDSKLKYPIIVDKFSNREVKSRNVYTVRVNYKVLSDNKDLSSSLVEIAISSVKWHFTRVYASNRVASILGDILYNSRMSTLLGVPINIHIQHALAYNMQPLPNRLAEALYLPKGVEGHSLIPTMLHLKRIFLPSFHGEDLIIDTELPPHFQWTAEKLNLFDARHTSQKSEGDI